MITAKPCETGTLTIVHGADHPDTADAEPYDNSVRLQFKSWADMQKALSDGIVKLDCNSTVTIEGGE